MPEQEKRHHVRIQFERQVRLEFFAEVYDNCQVKNISLGGMYIAGRFPHDLAGQCFVNFTQTSNHASLTLQALAKVVRQDDQGLAITFTSMSFESLLSLEMVLLYQEREKSAAVEIKLPEELPFEISDDSARPQGKYNFLLDRGK